MWPVAVAVAFAAGAGVLIEKGILVGGAFCAAVAAFIFLAFVRAQRRIAAALSGWFEVKISAGQLPLMNPKRFDAWRERAGLHHGQAERREGQYSLEPLRLKYTHNWGPIHWSGRGRRDPGQ